MQSRDSQAGTLATGIIRSTALCSVVALMKHVSVLLASAVLLGGCISLKQPTSPEVNYSKNSTDSRALQVPPDLTNISNGEQFILPGTGGGAVARNSLLPEFKTARYVRQGGQNWLETSNSPDELWPKLLAFARNQKFSIEQTEPVAGVIVTQWRADSDMAESGLLKNLIGKNDNYSRIAFRLERATNGTRLFARSQQINNKPAESANSVVWPANSHDPEQVSALLIKLLVFLGVEEQRARGILSDAQASNVLYDAVVQTSAAGSQLILHKGFKPSFDALSSAVERLEYTVRSQDDGLGVIEVVAAAADSTPIVVRVAPVHISAVQVSLSDSQGRRLDAGQERDVLQRLRAALI